MSPRVDEQELRRRAIEGVRAEVEAFAAGAAESRLIEHPGLLASLVPASPQRSLFNSVYYERPAGLAERLDELEAEYEASGVRAWTVWVPDEDRETAALLERRGHVLDAEPRAMALDLDDLSGEPVPPPNVTAAPIEPAVCAALNDRAYGLGDEGFGRALAVETSIRWLGAFEGGTPLACVGTIEVDGDCCVTGVATPPEHGRRGIASWLLWTALSAARELGLTSASLQATRAGAPLYERLGFRDFGFVEMWEKRR